MDDFRRGRDKEPDFVRQGICKDTLDCRVLELISSVLRDFFKGVI